MTGSPRRSKIHQFHYWAAPSDAITNQMVLINQALSQADMGGEIFSVSIKEGAPKNILKWSPGEVGPDDLLLIHHSQGNPMLEELLALNTKRALVYHNITPADFFKHDPHIASLCRRGREQLPLFKDRIECAFTVSDYNALELDGSGIGPLAKLPLFDFETLAEKMKSVPRKTATKPFRILFVGRLSTHKNQASLIETFFFLRQFQPQCELELIGTGDPIYSQYLKDLVQALELTDCVRFLGSVSESARNERYRDASLFLCLSQHEGFCIPVVEAMAAGVPVVSTPHGALSETLGGAGVILNTEQPAEVAAVVQAIWTDKTALLQIASEQKRRLGEIAKEQNAKVILKALLPSAGTKRQSPAKPAKKIKGPSHAPKRPAKRTKTVR